MSSPRSLSVRRVDVSSGAQLVIEDASLESGEVVDACLIAVPGATYSDAEAKLKGRCFGIAEEVGPLLARALHDLGQPEATHARLQATPVRDMLTGPMSRRLLPWVAVGCLLTFAGIRSMCAGGLHRDRGNISAPFAPTAVTRSDGDEHTRRVEASHARADSPAPRHVAPEATVEVESVRDRCEPLEWPLCPRRGELCAPMSDGTSRRCVQRTRSHGAVELVCVPSVPGKAIKKWRRARLRTIVDSVCTRRQDCDPGALTDYLTVLADRETSRRPWKRHRLDVDLESAAKAWRTHADRYASSPAHAEPVRWATGLGYYGQNPALWLAQWDARAEPETLCGEVESTLAHLRGARRRLRRLGNGVDCGGVVFRGSSESGDPSWYDVSLVNSGSERCPAQPSEGKRWRVRQSFARRAARQGLAAYAPVTLGMLGAPVERDEQDAFAAELYAQLERGHGQT